MIIKTNNNPIQSLSELIEFATLLSKSELIPSGYKGKPENILTAIQLGQEIGLKPLQSLQSIYVVNGKPTLYGDAMIALVRNHPDFEDIKEWQEGDTAYCEVKRKGQTPCLRQFSMEDARLAGLTTRNPVWKAYPKRMLQMKARGFALRDSFPDALSGLITIEEAIDYPKKKESIDLTPAPISLLPEEEAMEIFNDYIGDMQHADTIEELQTIYCNAMDNPIAILTEEQKQILIETAKARKSQLSSSKKSDAPIALLPKEDIDEIVDKAIKRIEAAFEVKELEEIYRDTIAYGISEEQKQALIETAKAKKNIILAKREAREDDIRDGIPAHLVCFEEGDY